MLDAAYAKRIGVRWTPRRHLPFILTIAGIGAIVAIVNGWVWNAKLDAGAIRKAKAAAGPGIKPGTYEFTLAGDPRPCRFPSLLRDSRKFAEGG